MKKKNYKKRRCVKDEWKCFNDKVTKEKISINW